jgi:hypothetical protein
MVITINPQKGGMYYNLHFTDKETELPCGHKN